MKWIYHFPDEFLHIDYFMNPLPALAMVGMALNDHWWKSAYPSWLTGKLSDFLGVFYFPLFLCAMACVIWNLLLGPVFDKARVAYISRRMMIVGMIITAVLMAVVKLSPEASAFVQNVFSNWLFPIRLTADPGDLISFVMLPLSYRYAREFFDRGPGLSS